MSTTSGDRGEGGQSEEERGPRSFSSSSISSPQVELPFVDREVELATMQSVLKQTVTQGHGAIIFLSGEPGIAKSRLVEEFLKRAGGVRRFFTKCMRVESMAPYAPWIDMIRQFA